MSDDATRGLESPDTIDAPPTNHPPSERDRRETPIGVDIGEKNLYTLCPIDCRDWPRAHEICGDDICDQLDALRSQVAALLASSYDREPIAAYVQQRHDAIREAIDAAARECCEYAIAYDEPVFVTEDSHYQPRFWDWLVDPDAHRGTSWLLAIAHLRLRVIAAEYAIPVATVPEEYSTQECHACGVLGDRVLNTTLVCHNPDCHVDTVTADRNAATVLAQRYYPGRCCAYRTQPPATETDDRPARAHGGYGE